MKAYLPFGDWSEDGHCEYEELLVEVDNIKDLVKAQQKIISIYGSDFFKRYANDYDTPEISLKGWQALIDNDMPIKIVSKYSEAFDWKKFKNLQDILDFYSPEEPPVDLYFVERSFIWLLNKYGANIKICKTGGIPQINSWTCPGFQTVGYGCFW